MFSLIFFTILLAFLIFFTIFLAFVNIFTIFFTISLAFLIFFTIFLTFFIFFTIFVAFLIFFTIFLAFLNFFTIFLAFLSFFIFLAFLSFFIFLTFLIFFTIFLAFLIIFPGVRKQRFTTFTSVTLSLFVGTVILVARHGSGWHVGSAEIVGSYKAFSREKVVAGLGAYVGLEHVNVTLTALPGAANSSSGGSSGGGEDIRFNERFSWRGPREMGRCYKDSLVRGLPFPILTVAEYFSLAQEGFSWGGQYRAAGYYASIILWTAFGAWLLMNLLLVVVPRYGAYAMAATGGLLLLADLVYYGLLPATPLVVHLEGSALAFSLGWCFWVVLCAGMLCVVSGTVIATVDVVYPHRFSTVLEVDYDTPYDRHIIIEESHDTRNKKKNNNTGGQQSAPGPRLEQPPGVGLGTKLLRRLSKRETPERRGIDNDAFEMDPPKSPWRYPFQRSMLAASRLAASSGAGPGAARQPASSPLPPLPPLFGRTLSQDSASSGESSLGLTFLLREAPASVHEDPAAAVRRIPMEKQVQQDVAMW
ncbi:dual oxidase maturation factor 1-like [Bacillus rossius redtenbacheri]|uniref:dual oxidase maturation factor 1-like n=1 Tax=Bacillus rossius redtenbacheri TaxID=93214 RepID=UPI002FDD64DA